MRGGRKTVGVLLRAVVLGSLLVLVVVPPAVADPGHEGSYSPWVGTPDCSGIFNPGPAVDPNSAILAGQPFLTSWGLPNSNWFTPDLKEQFPKVAYLYIDGEQYGGSFVNQPMTFSHKMDAGVHTFQWYVIWSWEQTVFENGPWWELDPNATTWGDIPEEVLGEFIGNNVHTEACISEIEVPVYEDEAAAAADVIVETDLPTVDLSTLPALLDGLLQIDVIDFSSLPAGFVLTTEYLAPAPVEVASDPNGSAGDGSGGSASGGGGSDAPATDDPGDEQTTSEPTTTATTAATSNTSAATGGDSATASAEPSGSAGPSTSTALLLSIGAGLGSVLLGLAASRLVGGRRSS